VTGVIPTINWQAENPSRLTLPRASSGVPEPIETTTPSVGLEDDAFNAAAASADE
jgi:hypothetical protein